VWPFPAVWWGLIAGFEVGAMPTIDPTVKGQGCVADATESPRVVLLHVGRVDGLGVVIGVVSLIEIGIGAANGITVLDTLSGKYVHQGPLISPLDMDKEVADLNINDLP